MSYELTTLADLAAVKAALGVGSNISNFAPPNMSKFRAKIAQLRAGGSAQVRIACLGDSTSAGFGATAADGYTNQQAKAYPTQLSTLLTRAGLTARQQSWWGNQNGGSKFPALDSRLTLNAGWGVSSSKSISNFALTNSTTANPLAFTPSGSWDTADIWYIRFSGGGTFTANIDGGSTLATQSTNGANALLKVTVGGAGASITPGTHTLNIVRSSGAFLIVGVDCYNAAAPDVSVWNWGWSGATVADWNINTVAYSPLSAISAVGPDLTIVNLQLNDEGAGTSLATYTTNLQAIITAAQVSGDVILVAANPRSSVSAAVAQTYIQVIRSLAVLNGCTFIDLDTRWGSYAAASALSPSFYYDLIHPSAAGYADISAAIAPAVLWQ